MRSRYTAFARQNVDYILKTQTTLPEKASRLELERDLSTIKWLRLEVISYTSVSQTQAQVEFCAYAMDSSGSHKQLVRHHEISLFCLAEKGWLYESGKIQADSGELKWQRNAPCVCGSGRKFKRCCA